jgi:hypothetical protein
VTGFSADWLDLREPYDLRARSPAVLDALAAAVAGRESVAVVDLACGAGATRRAIASRLSRRQSWRLVDNDPRLLARAAEAAPTAGTDVAAFAVDLARDLEAALAEPVDLVTVSALLDLVSAEWLDRLAAAIAARGLSLYAALTYDGRVTFEPTDALDARMIAAVNQHQRGDKGFGPALGPTAAFEAIARFEALGYAIVQDVSDWTFGGLDRAIQSDLLAGWGAAAREVGSLTRAEIEGWLARRRNHVASGRSSMRVGHVDFFARPIGTRRAAKSQSNNSSPSSGWTRIGGRSA